jgi:hypothetical protein
MLFYTKYSTPRSYVEAFIHLIRASHRQPFEWKEVDKHAFDY